MLIRTVGKNACAQCFSSNAALQGTDHTKLTMEVGFFSQNGALL